MRISMDIRMGSTQSQNPGVDAKSKPRTTQSLVHNSSDAKSSLRSPSSPEKEELTKEKDVEWREIGLEGEKMSRRKNVSDYAMMIM
jgi:hypothetical protein